ncbi:MAG: hypothetical protein KKH92_09775 [Firmicutes bacterium]|nr:hypothetical protein [Bacillota bacterium]
MRVSIRLNLPKAINKLTVRYNTFEKVSYDKYFIASLISNTKTQSKAFELIDEMTGNGSLNDHFKKVYAEMIELSLNEIESILKDSLYPIQKIEEFTYAYIPMVNISIFGGNVFIGNIAETKFFAQQLVEKGGTYISHNFDIKEPVSKPDYYEVNLSNEIIEIGFNKDFYRISNEDFVSSIIKDDIDFTSFQGNLSQSLQGNGWIQLSRSTFNNIASTKDFYYDNGDHIAIYNDNAKRSSFAYSWGLYWVKEKTYLYQDSANQKMCENIAEVLLQSGRINEFKTKTILDILKNISRDKQQEIVNYILKRKESKEIAKVGLILISKGYEKNWSEDAMKSFYKFKENINQLIMLYKVNPNMGFALNDILDIYKSDKTILTDEHLNQTREYFSDCEAIKKRVRDIVGRVVLSGSRENEKSMVMDEATKKFRKSANNIQGHFKRDIDKMDLNELKQFEKQAEKLYEEYKIVYNRLQEEQN